MPLLFAEGMNGPRLRRDISVTGVVWSVTQRLGVSISRMPRFSLTLFGIEKKKQTREFSQLHSVSRLACVPSCMTSSKSPNFSAKQKVPSFVGAVGLELFSGICGTFFPSGGLSRRMRLNEIFVSFFRILTVGSRESLLVEMVGWR